MFYGSLLPLALKYVNRLPKHCEVCVLVHQTAAVVTGETADGSICKYCMVRKTCGTAHRPAQSQLLSSARPGGAIFSRLIHAQKILSQLEIRFIRSYIFNLRVAYQSYIIHCCLCWIHEISLS